MNYFAKFASLTIKYNKNIKTKLILRGCLALFLLGVVLVSCKKESPSDAKKEEVFTKQSAADMGAVSTEMSLKGTRGCKVNNKAGQECIQNNAGDCKKLTNCTALAGTSVILENANAQELQGYAHQFAVNWANEGVIDSSYVLNYSNQLTADLIEYYINGNLSIFPE